MTGNSVQELVRTICIGVCVFLLGLLVVNTASLTVFLSELSHTMTNTLSHGQRIEFLQGEIQRMRDEQLSRTKKVYSIQQIERDIQTMQEDLNSRKNIRWNLPDMIWLSEEFRKLNPNIKMPVVENKHGSSNSSPSPNR